MELDLQKLKSELVQVYAQYLIAETKDIAREAAVRIYVNYRDAVPLLPPKVALAISLLVDMSFKTGVPLTEVRAKEILSILKKE